MWPNLSLGELWRAAGKGAISLLFPPRCFVCGEELPSLSPLCSRCLEDLELFAGKLCAICGHPVGEEVDICRECAVEPRPFAWARSLGPHHGILRALVLGMKYEGERVLARFLSGFLIPLLPRDAEIITFVPPDPGRKGDWHAAELLARELSRLSGTVLEPLLVKTRSTPPQVSLGYEERRENLKGAFAARRSGRGEWVVLVDDVYTTGTTAAECSRALISAGFGEVVVLTASRTIRHED